MGKQGLKERKPHVNVGTIGHVDHGKTTRRLQYKSSRQRGSRELYGLRRDRQSTRRESAHVSQSTLLTLI